MLKTAHLCGGSAIAMAMTANLWAGDAQAQAKPAPTTVEEVIVTGSFIRGAATDAALPVDVIGASELQKQGSPSTLDMIKALPISNGVLGDTNQFDARAQGSEGSGSVNLRGLGSQRTLVLLNGRRMAINPFGQAGAGIVDTNIIPSAAIGRIEVLKDGAGSTYGSDAIAGVVNFITKKHYDGLEAAADYRYIDGSDGDYGLNVTYGKVWDQADLLLTVGWQHRSKLSIKDRDWANQPYLSNPEAGWSAAGNPGSFVSLAAPTVVNRDPQCAPLGGYPGFSGATPVCYWHYTPYDNLVEKQDSIQLFGQINADLTDKTKLHVEALYAHTDVPEWNTSPSYAALAVPTAEAAPAPSLAGRYYVPGNNPGLIDFIAKNPAYANLAAGGLIAANRPFGLGGNPMFGYGPSIGARAYDAARVSADLSGEWRYGIGWDVALTYSQESAIRTGYDTMVNRFELAMRGLGGPNCNIAANTPGQNGCLWYNPFSNAIAVNPITGQTNPQFNPAVANSPEVTRWFFQKLSTKQTSRLFVADAVLNGKTGFSLPGGEVSWAGGFQYRRSYFKADYNDLSNALINPCVNTPDFGVVNCTGSVRNGPFMFLGVSTPSDLENDVWATFGELSAPITHSLQVQVALRYEDYGGATGSTLNPKIAVRWQATDWLTLRGSAGSTFRGPPVTTLNTNSVTSLQSILGTFRAVDIYGNPNLDPEKAKTYNFGAIFKLADGAFRASVDWWKFDFDNPIVAEPVGGIVNAMFPNGATGTNNCGVAAYAALQSRFTFNGACSPANIARLRTSWVNGPAVNTSGLDFSANYTWREVFRGDIAVGIDATYLIDHKVAAESVEGVPVSAAFDAAGKLNYQTTEVPLPKWKGAVYAEWTTGPHNLRATLRYIDGYDDQRTAPFAAGAYRDSAGNPVTITQGQKIDSQVTVDLAYRVFLPWQTTLSAAITNLFDQDPSYARLDLGYDPFTGDPLGRTFKLSLRKKF